MAVSMAEVKKRWIRCLVWQQVAGAVIWTAGDAVLTLAASPLGFVPPRGLLPSLSMRFFRFLVFQFCVAILLVAHYIVTSPEEKSAASALELAAGAMGAALGGGWWTGPLRQRAQTTADWALFVFTSMFGGFLAVFSMTAGFMRVEGTSSFDMALRGAALGFVYGVHYIYRKRWVVNFPIIQRPLFFSLKMGIPSAGKMALKLSLVALPCALALMVVLHSTLQYKGIRYGFLNLQILFFIGAYPIVFCWELIHHLIQVVHTRRYVFAPPQGSAAAETNPTDQLVIALKDSDPKSLAQYLAYLDLCMVSENNVDSWRRAALFEETGETYKRIILACLKPLEEMATRLSEGLDGSSVDKTSDVLSQQMRSPTDYPILENVKEAFNGFQLCSWCARTVASLTASSRDEDRFGVAQLTGCNGAVVSTLLSCLLIVEVYLGKRSNIQSMHLLGPASIKWTVPSRGVIGGKKQVLHIKKNTLPYKKAYAMADVLHTSIYQIVSVFQDEMLLGGSGIFGLPAAERDWLSKSKPLYGTHDMLLQKLRLFLEFRAS
uniref:TSA: Wollemia nobilis Ref_Wollemi_Transcript_14496_1988 transcribed RNA sequence n=1 Tax=Wollemia nobilis TaxID=56998 RepID=A0A0C9RSU8_9CONI